MKLALLLSLPLLLVPAAARELWDTPPFSATPGELVEAASQAKVPEGAQVIYILRDTINIYEADGRKTYRYHAIYQVLNAAAVRGWSASETTWRPWYEARPSIRARVVTPDGAVHILDPKTIDDAPAGDGSEDVYSDTRVLRAPLPAVAAGSIIEEEIAITQTAPFFAGGTNGRMYFGLQTPSRRTRLTLDYPASLPIRHVVRLLPKLDVKRREENGRVRLVFEHGPMDAVEDEEEYLPSDVPSGSYVAFSTGASWKEVAASYARISGAQLTLGGLETILKSVRTDGRTPAELGAELLAAVHKYVRYTGVEFGDASIVPRTPAETLKRRFGDCKDKSALLVALLRASGIPAHLALLATGPGRDVEPDLPGLGSFDHAIVYVPGSPAYWADPTQEYARFGELPTADQGRLALIVAEDTQALVRTPESKSSDNGFLEQREFYLSEQGKSRVVETTEAWGAVALGYRAYYASTETKAVAEMLQEYAKSNYLSEDAPKYEFSAPGDLTKRFRLRVEMTNAGRGATDLEQAVVGIQAGNLLDRLPDVFKEEKPPKRKSDFVFPETYTSELRYRIIPPPGYRPVALPGSGKQALGPAVISKEFSAAPDGVVAAVLRFDTVKSRLTPTEFEAMAAAVRDFRSSPAWAVRFEQIGEALLKAGKVREAIGEFRGLAALHSKEALHRTQVARALLQAGAAESARAEAREATRLEPKSAYASAILAWILGHDLVGRRFKKGCDIAGAEAAYRKAIELDPENTLYPQDLAILLEHAPNGVRYASRAKLEEAIKIYRKLEGKLTGAIENNILFALLWSGRFAEARDLARTRKQIPGPLLLAAVAGSDGLEAALAEASARIPTEQERRQALLNAGQMLLNLRLYSKAADLLAAGASGAPNAASVLASVEMLRRAQRYEDLPEPDTPGAFLRKLMPVLFVSEAASDDQLRGYFAAKSLLQKPESIRALRLSMASVRIMVMSAGLPTEVAADLTVAVSQTVEDDDGAGGYRVLANMSGPATSHQLTAYVLKENGKFRLWSMGETASLGAYALAALQRGQLDAARRWLDWAREVATPAGGDDPLAGSVFPRLWTKGAKAGVDETRLAAAALVAEGEEAAPAIPILAEARENAPSVAKRALLDAALASAYSTAGKLEALVETSRRLLELYPESETAFVTAVMALRRLQRWDDAKKLIANRLERDPNDLVGIRMAADVAMYSGDLDSAIRHGKRVVQLGKAHLGDLNNLAWTYLLAGSSNAEALDAARRAVSAVNGNDFSVLHTLASLYAEAGKTSEAREVILKAMDVGGQDEPDESSWYVFGRIAEQYEIRQDAISAYKRLKRPEETRVAASTWSLAQRRLAVLNQK